MAIKKIYAISLIESLSWGLLLPVAGIHVMSLGGSRFLLGVLASLHSLLQLITGPIIGSLSDTKGRKPLLLKALFVVLIANSLLTINSLYVYILSRTIYGISSQVNLLLKPLIADNVPDAQQAGEFAKIGALTGVAFIISPIIGGHITEYENGFYYLALLLCALTIVHIGITLTLPEDKNKFINSKKNNDTKSGVMSNLKKMDWGSFWDIFALKLLTESTISMFYSNFGLILITIYNSSQIEIGYVIAFFSFTNIVANLTLTQIKAKFYKNDTNSRQRNIHSLLGLGLVFFSLYFAPNFWVYVLLMAPLGFFKTLLDDTWMESLLKRSNASEKGTVLGAYESMLQLAGLVTPIFAGYISEIYELNTANLFCTIPVVIGALIAATIKIPNKTKSN